MERRKAPRQHTEVIFHRLPEKKIIDVSWNMVETAAKMLHHRLALIQFSGVYGPPRGGLVLAVMMSHRLNLPLLSAPFEGCLVVDDIVHTGRTFDALGNYGTGPKFKASLYVTPEGAEKVDWFAYETSGKDWVEFPWEKGDLLAVSLGTGNPSKL